VATTFSGGNSEKTALLITPIIDILLVLVVIFLVVAPGTPRTLQTQVPEITRPEPSPLVPHHDVVLSASTGFDVLSGD
jgi:biopolymer transport protein ExbD